MTPEKFVKTIKSCRTGHKGFCKFASIESKNVIYNLGFWFEIVMNNGKVIVITVHSNFWTVFQNRKTIIFNEVSQLTEFIDNERQKAQDEISSLYANKEAT